MRVLVQDETIADDVRRLDAQRGTSASETAILVIVVGESPSDAIPHERLAGGSTPLGMVTRTEAEAFAAVAAGADEACSVEGLDHARFMAFIDRIALRATQRREVENRRAAQAHAEKLAALGTIVTGVAHEINNPLAVVTMSHELLRAGVDPLVRAQEEIFRLASRGTYVSGNEMARLAEIAHTGAAPSELRASLDDATTGLRIIADVVRDLRVFARVDEEEKTEAVYLPDLVDQVLRVVGRQITCVAALERDYGADVPTLLLPRTRVTQVLTNLLINAAHAIEEMKRPVHRVRISIRHDSDTIALSISDTGAGIAPDIIERIFDPFFTTKQGARESGGTGLGLSISRSILQGLGGDLIAESVHGEGATFVAMIPTEGRKEAVVSRAARFVTARIADAGRSSVLVVEDEEALLRSLALALRQRFHVLLAADGQEAIDLLASGSRPDAILCDLAMPVVNGFQLHDWLEENHPDLARHMVFLTANAEDEGALRFFARVDKPVLEKPVTRDKLLSVLDRVVSH